MEKLKQAIWAKQTNGQLISIDGEQPIQMQHSDGTALPLVVDESKANKFGADVIRFAPAEGVGLHTHVGAHILLVTKGEGILTYGKDSHPMFTGMIYLIPANTPHAIQATTELVLIAVGNDHQPAGSLTRLDVVGDM